MATSLCDLAGTFEKAKQLSNGEDFILFPNINNDTGTKKLRK